VKESDIELITRARSGDEMAFRALLSRYQRGVYGICLRMIRNRDEAADLSQEAFVKVFSMLDRYNPSFAFSSWLFKIATNLCIDFMRKRRIETFAMDEPIESEKGEIQRQYEAPEPDPEQELLRKETMERLNDAIEKLPPHYRIMLILRHQENLSYEEIAASLDIPLGTVKARIHRAREMLKASLEGKDFF
jgi:RNA polymerase sigma-70 factor (ECF subfamily)